MKAELDCRCLHGDVFQNERNEIISAFKARKFPILVATDVAARGLDIAHVRYCTCTLKYARFTSDTARHASDKIHS